MPKTETKAWGKSNCAVAWSLGFLGEVDELVIESEPPGTDPYAGWWWEPEANYLRLPVFSYDIFRWFGFLNGISRSFFLPNNATDHRSDAQARKHKAVENQHAIFVRRQRAAHLPNDDGKRNRNQRSDDPATNQQYLR